MPWEVKVCKLADIFDNMIDLPNMPARDVAAATRAAGILSGTPWKISLPRNCKSWRPRFGSPASWRDEGEDMRPLAIASVPSPMVIASSAVLADEAEDKAIALVMGLGGDIEPRSGQTGRPVVRASISTTPRYDTDANLKDLAGFPPSCAPLGLSGTKITDKGLKALAAFDDLEVIGLNNTKITDGGLHELAKLKQIRGLDLSATKVTDQGVKNLAALKQLGKLSLNDTTVTDAGLKDLIGFQELRELFLKGTMVTAAGLRNFREARPDCRAARVIDNLLSVRAKKVPTRTLNALPPHSKSYNVRCSKTQSNQQPGGNS